MDRTFTMKEMESAVMIAGDLYQKFYYAESVDGGFLEVAQTIIDEAVKMEQWLVEKYGEDDDEYLDHLDEYEKMLAEKYELDKKMGDDYVAQLFWDHLPAFAEEFGVPRKEVEEEN